MDARNPDGDAVSVLPRGGRRRSPAPSGRAHGDVFLIGDVAALTGVTVHTLRAWEGVGLLAPRRSAAGTRQYTADDLARVRLIARTLNTRHFSRRVVAAMLASGELRPDAGDYGNGQEQDEDAPPHAPRAQRGHAAPALATTLAQPREGQPEHRLLDHVMQLGAVAVSREMTHERRHLQRETCLAAVTRAAVGVPDQAGEEGRAARVLAALVEHAGVPVRAASLHLYDDTRDTLHRIGLMGDNPARDIGDQIWDRSHPGWNALTVAPTYSAAEGKPPEWYDEDKRRVWPQATIRAWATVPLRVGNQLFGALAVGFGRAHTWDGAERAWIEACADAVALALEYDRLYAAERRRANELEAVLQSVSEGITVFGLDGDILLRNAAAAVITGRDEFNGTIAERATEYALRDAATGVPMSPERTPVMRALGGETVRDVMLLMRDTAGEDRVVLSTSGPVRDRVGRVVAAVSVYRDITELQRMERMREEFLAVVAHELRTPLTGLLGFIHVIRRKRPKGPDDTQDTIADYLHRIERQALRIDRLVGDLLDVVRIQQGQLQYHWATGDVAGAVAEAADEQRATHPDRRIMLSLPEEALPARFDPDRIGQVVTNLLTNALKYSRTDREVAVMVGVERGEDGPGEAIVRVRDAGTGIPREHLDRVFERFYRVPGVDVQSGSGIGLGVGLHVAHEIVQRHGGRIWAESEVGKGSSFNFTLPLLARDGV